MTRPSRSPAYNRAWRSFLALDRRLDAIHGRHRIARAEAASRGLAEPAMSPTDRAEVARLEAEVARLAAVMAREGPATAAPLRLSPVPTQVARAYRLAGWPQDRIDRKLAGERLARLDRHIERMPQLQGVARQGDESHAGLAQAAVSAADPDDLLAMQDERLRLAAEIERLDSRRPDRPDAVSADRHARPNAVARQWEARAEAILELDHALDHLHHILATHPVSDEQLDAQIRCAGEQVLAQHALEVVPVAVALREIGFRPVAPGSADWQWEGEQGRRRLRVDACKKSGDWRLTIADPLAGPSTTQIVERDDSVARGQVALAILRIWRRAFGHAARPPGALDIGRFFEQRRERLGRGDLSLPRMELDGPALRAVRQRIRRRFGAARAVRATLSMADGLLRIAVEQAVYTVPAQGGMGMPCAVAAADLVSIPPACLRGRTIGVDRGWKTLGIDWYVIETGGGEPVVEA